MLKALRSSLVVFLEVLIGRRCVACHKDNLTSIITVNGSKGKRHYRECRDCGALMDVPSALM